MSAANEAKAMGDLRVYVIESGDRRDAAYKAVLRTPVGGYHKAVRDSIEKACAAAATQARVAAEQEVGQ